MDPVLEEQGVARVIDRLGERFPELDRGQVEQAVHTAHLALSGNPIRDFIPVLVEHDAKDQLRQLVAGRPMSASV
jgi:hypothetical protein